jgi:hypothetical protein
VLRSDIIMFHIICLLLDHKYRLRDDRTVFKAEKISYCGRCKEFFSITEIHTINQTIYGRCVYLITLLKLNNWICVMKGHEYTLRCGYLSCNFCSTIFNRGDHKRIVNKWDCLAWRFRHLRERKKSHDPEKVC